jgi:protein gp37
LNVLDGWFDCLGGWRDIRRGSRDAAQWIEQRVDWVIVGGESGPNARPMHPDWVRSLRDQCARAGVPYLFKQWGEWLPGDLEDEGSRFVWQWAHEHRAAQLNPAEYERRYIVKTVEGVDFGKVGKKIAGRTLDGREHSEFPRAA